MGRQAVRGVRGAIKRTQRDQFHVTLNCRFMTIHFMYRSIAFVYI